MRRRITSPATSRGAQDQALSGALVAGVLAQAGGLSPEEVRAAQDLGAEVAARSYSREFELEADALGAADRADCGL